MIGRLALAALFAIGAPAASVLACEIPAAFPAQNRIDGKGYVLGFRAVPAKIELGEHFSVEAVVCAKGASAAPRSLGVDAQMPEHRHGMNYRAKVSPRGDGRYLAEGLMFHMPGRWQFVFDVEGAGMRERLTKDVVVE
jgi:hypothetical protein